MASIIADEDVPLPLVGALRVLGHDVLTAFEAGRANQKIPDAEVLKYATAKGRAVLTRNRNDFRRLHMQSDDHAGIITFTPSNDTNGLAKRIDEKIKALSDLAKQLISC
jgi:predicted nuclease of predicted toxin-antitoxin system